ncbi:hypothetical protein [Marinomonas sp. 2405UD68-3]|uniref:hypothetical protein n=1 Tax=Marinomonas sp. 2405UD68-3 TaxID=3391835 RepID=UPI0039C8CD40
MNALSSQKSGTVLDHFAVHVRNAPDQTAVFHASGTLNYQELSSRSDSLAAYLQQSGINDAACGHAFWGSRNFPPLK